MNQKEAETTPRVVFGIGEVLPLRGFPAGKARVRQRPDEFTRVFIRPPNGGIRKFIVQVRDGAWWPLSEEGKNLPVEQASIGLTDAGPA